MDGYDANGNRIYDKVSNVCWLGPWYLAVGLRGGAWRGPAAACAADTSACHHLPVCVLCVLPSCLKHPGQLVTTPHIHLHALQVNGQTCHQCRQKTLGKRTCCSGCESLTVRAGLETRLECPTSTGNADSSRACSWVEGDVAACAGPPPLPRCPPGLTLYVLPMFCLCCQHELGSPACPTPPTPCFRTGRVLRRLPVHAVWRARGRGKRQPRCGAWESGALGWVGNAALRCTLLAGQVSSMQHAAAPLACAYSSPAPADALHPPACLADWRCPMCRDLCNCSFHRSKRGWAPTGTLYRHAIAEGEACKLWGGWLLACLCAGAAWSTRPSANRTPGASPASRLDCSPTPKRAQRTPCPTLTTPLPPAALPPMQATRAWRTTWC